MKNILKEGNRSKNIPTKVLFHRQKTRFISKFLSISMILDPDKCGSRWIRIHNTDWSNIFFLLRLRDIQSPSILNPQVHRKCYIFKWLTGKILKTYVTETQFACSSELMLSNEHLLFISGRENNTSANLPQSLKCHLPVFFFNQADTDI
jgi:hypothetical protein